MKIFSVIGYSQSGKTTTIESIIGELKKRRFTVGSVKNIHCKNFTIDTEGTNTHRHKMAGSELVTALSDSETDVLFPRKLSLNKILGFYDHDYVVLEGVSETNAPKIITAHTKEAIDEKLDDTVFAISGRISNELKEYKGIPVINALENADKLVDLIEKTVYERLPEFPEDCCDACGYSCRDLGIRILQGKSKREDCLIDNKDEIIQLFIGNQKVPMVSFVQKILHNAVMGVVSELEGYDKASDIVIKVGENNDLL